MRLPASLLSTLRVGLGATALVAGCDAPELQSAPEPEPATVVSAPARVEAEPEAAPVDGLAAEVSSLVERASAEARPRVRRSAEEIVAAASPVLREVAEDPTAFVPFSEEPANAAPIRPRPRVRPKPRPRTRPRPRTEPQQVRGWNPPPAKRGWSSDPCPACGRG